MQDGNTLATFTLAETEIHIWQASLAVSTSKLQQFAQTLSADEQARAKRFRFSRDSQRFVASRGILRALLGHYLETPPAQLQFCYGENGKPFLADVFAASGIAFNLSHSEDLMLCAIARHQPIGIDLEYLRPVAHLENLTQRFFSPQEHAAIHALTGELCVRSFFQHWTCKEALLKATGDGLIGLNAIEVRIDRDTATLVNWNNHTQTDSNWLLQLLAPQAKYVAAVAMNAPNRSLFLQQWRNDT